MGGCCYGIPCKYGFVMKESPNVTRFPVQLVEAGFEILIFLLLLCLEKHNKKQLLNCYLLLYAPVRFVLEYFRGDEIRGVWGFISTSQIISLLLVLIVIINRVNRIRNLKIRMGTKK